MNVKLVVTCEICGIEIGRVSDDMLVTDEPLIKRNMVLPYTDEEWRCIQTFARSRYKMSLNHLLRRVVKHHLVGWMRFGREGEERLAREAEARPSQ